MKAAQDMMGNGKMESMMKNPQMMQMAQKLMQNPQMMQQAMSMLSGGGGGGSGGMPDLGALAGMMGGDGGMSDLGDTGNPSSGGFFDEEPTSSGSGTCLLTDHEVFMVIIISSISFYQRGVRARRAEALAHLVGAKLIIVDMLSYLFVSMNILGEYIILNR